MRFASGHAGADIVRRLLREMFFHFFEQALIDAVAGCEIREARKKTSQ